jgi:hypothetical protein
MILAAAVLLLATLLPTVRAEGPKVVNADVVGSVPNVVIRGVASGGAPWAVQNGHIQLDSSGRLRVRIRGLVIESGALANGDPVPPALVGTTGPVREVHAVLTCGGPGGGVPFTLTPTESVPLSPDGDCDIDAQIDLPAVCAQPIVLIRIGTPAAPGPWIAVSD